MCWYDLNEITKKNFQFKKNDQKCFYSLDTFGKYFISHRQVALFCKNYKFLCHTFIKANYFKKNVFLCKQMQWFSSSKFRRDRGKRVYRFFLPLSKYFAKSNPPKEKICVIKTTYKIENFMRGRILRI